MHICFSTIDYHSVGQGGGIASYLDAITPALVTLGHEVSIVGPGKTHCAFLNKEGVEIIQQPLGNLHWYLYKLRLPSWIYLPVREWEWSRNLYRAINKLHRRKPIDIIESHEIGLWQIVRKRKKLPPVLVRLHGSSYIFKVFSGKKAALGEKLMHRLELTWLEKVVAISAPGEYQANYYQRLLGKNITAIPNPVSPRFLMNNTPLTKAEQNHLILYTGRIEYRKGTLVLVEAFGELLKHYPKAKLIIAGAFHNSISLAQWQKAIDEAGIVDNLELLGHIPFKELQEYYRKATVFVMPSYYETFGISVIEAMAHGLPVVATNAGALPELVKDKHNGLTIPAGDARALAKALLETLEKPAEARQWGLNGQNMVLQRFKPVSIAIQLSEFYKKTRS